MNKYLIVFCMAGMLHGAPMFAQGDNLDLFKQIDKMDAEKKSTGTGADEKAAPADQPPPTIITATRKSSFDAKQRLAIFEGDVHINNPQFTLSADKLTVYFKKENDEPKQGQGAKPTATPTATPKPAAPSTGITGQQGGGIDKIVAEGNVIVESDRPDPNGGPPVHYVGKSEKMDYIPATGEAVLRGWPQIQKGIDSMAATESSTVIHLNRDGNMYSEGGQVKMAVHDPGPDKPTPGPAGTPGPSPVKTPEVQ